jgi:integrase
VSLPVAVPSTTEIEARVIAMVIDSVSSPHSKRAYARVLEEFQRWRAGNGNPPLMKASIQRYRGHLEERQCSGASINLRLAVLRKLAVEAADNGLLPPDVAAGILRIRGVSRLGRRLGRWLDLAGAQTLLNQPGGRTLKGLRDRALLAVLLGAGLRRDEASRLRIEQIVLREGRWIIADLTGKHNRIRSVPIAAWTKQSIDDWTAAAGLQTGRLFQALDKAGRIVRPSLSAQAIYEIVRDYCAQCGQPAGPHDLRRTFARLAFRGNAPLHEIQASMGHASLTTTERYLGLGQDLVHAPCDYLGLRLPAAASR